MSGYTLKTIARIRSDFPTKFGIPRQAGIVSELESLIVFETEYRNDEALRGIEDFSHLWLIWQFSENVREDWSPTVRPPRLGGNTRLGVFATRSPFRPNALGLSCVKLLGIEKREGLGAVLRVAGADLMDGTPIYDIKPYLPEFDAHPEACGGFASSEKWTTLDVEIPDDIRIQLGEARSLLVEQLLSEDPRPHYHDNPERVYGMTIDEYDIKFKVIENTVKVTNVHLS